MTYQKLKNTGWVRGTESPANATPRLTSYKVATKSNYHSLGRGVQGTESPAKVKPSQQQVL
jgi:hypothetical protein